MPGQGAVYIRDVSGNTALLDTSGRIQANITGGSLAVTSGTVGVSGLFPGAAVISGFGVSGMMSPTGLMAYDLSGQQWNPLRVTTSGSETLVVGIGNITAQGNVIASTRQYPQDGTINSADNLLEVASILYAFDTNGGAVVASRLRASVSGDQFRLRVSEEGRAPTYTVNAYNIGLSSGASMVGPQISIFNYGSGTGVPAYKIKGLFINPDPANVIASGQAVKFDVIRFTAFSGGGTLLSGVAHDTADPAYSGAVAAPALMQKAYSGVVLDGVFFSYVVSNEGPYVMAASIAGIENSVYDPTTQQLTNLIGARILDTKEIMIRSGYGFGIVQSSGFNYTQVFSGTFNYQLTYSVEA